MLKKILSQHLIILLSLITFSCASVPDVPVCKEITPDRGWCSYTLREGGFYVDDDRPYAFDPSKPEELYTWWQIRPQMIQVPAKSWKEIKAYIVKQCKRSGKCEGNVGEWFDKLEDVK